MKKNEKILNLFCFVPGIVGCFIMLTVNPLHAQLADSQWPMFKHDTSHTGRSSYAGPADNTLQWKYPLIGDIRSASPIIGPDGTIYICNKGVVFAINENGSLKWRSNLHLGGSGGSTLAISSDGTIYAPIYHTLYALNANGTLKWKYYSENEIASNPCIGKNNIIYVGSGLDLLAIKPDGSLQWNHRVGEEVRLSPAISQDGTIYVRGRENYLIALNADGTRKWMLNLGSTYSHTYMSPVIGTDGTIYTFGLIDDGNPYTTDRQVTGLYAINPNGTLKWVSDNIIFEDGTIQMTPAISQDGTIYLACRDLEELGPQSFCAINKSGILQWMIDFQSKGSFGTSSPAIDANGIIYFGTWGNRFYALNPNGTFTWEFETLNNIESSPAIGKNGTIYFGSWDGYLYAVGKAGKPIKPTVTKPAVIVPLITPLLLK